VEDPLLWLTLRQQFLTPPLRFKLLGFLPDTRLFIKHPPLQFAEESFSREFLLGNFEGFLDIIIKNFDFHGYVCLLSQVMPVEDFLVPTCP
jgi:hypothetical protein